MGGEWAGSGRGVGGEWAGSGRGVGWGRGGGGGGASGQFWQDHSQWSPGFPEESVLTTNTRHRRREDSAAFAAVTNASLTIAPSQTDEQNSSARKTASISSEYIANDIDSEDRAAHTNVGSEVDFEKFSKLFVRDDLDVVRERVSEPKLYSDRSVPYETHAAVVEEIGCQMKTVQGRRHVHSSIDTEKGLPVS